MSVKAKTTRERLLDTAEKLFFEKGYEGVSVRDLTDRAGVNVAAVNYHFQSKKNLYKEVVRRRLSTVAQRRIAELKQVAEGKRTPDLRKVIRTYVSGFLGDILSSKEVENFLNLVSREMSQPGIATDVLIKEIVSPIHKILKDAIHRARPALSEEKISLCIISISGQVLHFLRAREIIKRMLGHGYSKEFLNEVVEHITEFSLKGIG
jgi:AcrR family transcriptional regulator